MPTTETTCCIVGAGPAGTLLTMLLPQALFLPFCADRATATGHCTVITGAGVRELIVEGEGAARRVAGVRYRGVHGNGEVRARLVVGCDGRYSTLRHAAQALGI